MFFLHIDDMVPGASQRAPNSTKIRPFSTPYQLSNGERPSTLPSDPIVLSIEV